MSEQGAYGSRLRKRLFRLGDRWEDWCLDHIDIDADRPLWVRDLPFTLNEQAQRAFCRLLHHVPIGDQCGKPEHDFCAYCGDRRPGEATRTPQRAEDRS